MFGNLGEMAGMLKKAKEIQKNMQTMKDELAKSEYTASAAGDAVVAIVSGDFRVKQIQIAPGAATRSDLNLIVTDAVNAALDCAKNAAAEKMREATGGLNIPGLC